LLIEADAGQAAVRVNLDRTLTTIGSDPAARVRLAGVPHRWAVVQRENEQVWVRHLARDANHVLAPGQPLRLDGITLSLHRKEPLIRDGFPVQTLVNRLSEVENPTEALELMLGEIMQATGADSGAVIVREQDDYTIAVARERKGASLPEARELLSDHIVRETLQAGSRVWVQDAGGQDRYARIPSVVALDLKQVVCVPMRLHDVVQGAVFLGKRQLDLPFSRRQVDDLELLASMAVPLLVQLRRLPAGTGTAEQILIGECDMIRNVRQLVERVAPSDLSVLVLGQTGTGKELVASAVHAASPRAGLPMVIINCSAVPGGLLEAELFGCKKGAFTGAVADRKGRIEQANHSSLFLDEVGDMPLPMQAALLRVIENRVVTRLGENQERQVDFRLITATHKDLDEEVAAGRFRQDLLYRLREFTIELPPLSSRGPDILLLAQLFLRQTERHLSLSARRIGAEASRRIMVHPWPGNVRELRATMRRAAILCDRNEIAPEHLGLEGAGAGTLSVTNPVLEPRADLSRTLAEARDDFVIRYVTAILKKHEGDREAAAAALGISVRSLYRYLSQTH
jgi:transcriptional regulator with GAF, ATPase, and Fis domain